MSKRTAKTAKNFVAGNFLIVAATLAIFWAGSGSSFSAAASSAAPSSTLEPLFVLIRGDGLNLFWRGSHEENIQQAHVSSDDDRAYCFSARPPEYSAVTVVVQDTTLFKRFSDVTNRLQDCGVYKINLYVGGSIRDRSPAHSFSIGIAPAVFVYAAAGKTPGTLISLEKTDCFRRASVLKPNRTLSRSANLPDLVAKLRRNTPLDKPLFIRANSDVPMSIFIKLLRMLTVQGYANISVRSENLP
jgi:biopolymer transport protein ExbD